MIFGHFVAMDSKQDQNGMVIIVKEALQFHVIKMQKLKLLLGIHFSK